jgi:hypothetical protein
MEAVFAKLQCFELFSNQMIWKLVKASHPTLKMHDPHWPLASVSIFGCHVSFASFTGCDMMLVA